MILKCVTIKSSKQTKEFPKIYITKKKYQEIQLECFKSFWLKTMDTIFQKHAFLFNKLVIVNINTY